MQDTIQNITKEIVNDEDAKKFLTVIIGQDELDSLINSEATAKEAAKDFDAIKKFLNKRAQGLGFKGAQFLPLYEGHDLKRQDDESMEKFINFLKDNFAKALNFVGAYIADLEEKDKKDAEEDTEEESTEDNNVATVVDREAFKSGITEGLRNQQRITAQMVKSIEEAFEKLQNTYIPYGKNPDSKDLNSLNNINNAFIKAAKGHLEAGDLGLVIDFYGTLKDHPEEALKKYPMLAHFDKASIEVSLEKLRNIIAKEGKIPQNHKGVPAEVQEETNEDKKINKAISSISSVIIGISDDSIKAIDDEGRANLAEVPWLGLALDVLPIREIVSGLSREIRDIKPISLKSHSEDLAKTVIQLYNEPFGKKGIGLLNTDIAAMEKEILAALGSYQKVVNGALRNHVGYLEDLVKHENSFAVVREPRDINMNMGGSQHTNSPIADPKVTNPRHGLPDDYAKIPQAVAKYGKSSNEALVNKTIIKSFDLRTVVRSLSRKDIGSEWVEMKRDDPMVGLREGLTKAYKVLSTADVSEMVRAAKEFSSDAPDSPISVIESNTVDMVTYLGEVHDIAEILMNLFHPSTNTMTNPFGSAIPITDGMSDDEMDEVDKANEESGVDGYERVIVKLGAHLEEKLQENINVNPRSPDFLRINTTKVLEDVRSLLGTGTVSLTKEDVPKFLSERNPIATDRRAISSLHTYLTNVSSLLVDLGDNLEALGDAYDLTINLMSKFENNLFRVAPSTDSKALLQHYKNAVGDPNFNVVLNKRGLNPSFFGTAKIKNAAKLKENSKIKRALNDFQKGLSTLKELAEGAIPDLKNSEAFDRLGEFLKALSSESGDVFFENMMLPVLASKLPGEAIGEFVNGYAKFGELSKNVIKAQESAKSLGTILGSSVAEAVGAKAPEAPSKTKTANLVKKASELASKGLNIEAAKMLRIAARAWGAIPKATTKHSINTSILPTELKDFEGSVEHNAKVFRGVLDDLTKAVADTGGTIDHDKIKSAMNKAAELEILSREDGGILNRIKAERKSLISSPKSSQMKLLTNLAGEDTSSPAVKRAIIGNLKRVQNTEGDSEDAKEFAAIVDQDSLRYISMVADSIKLGLSGITFSVQNMAQAVKEDTVKLTEALNISKLIKSLKVLGAKAREDKGVLPTDALETVFVEYSRKFFDNAIDVYGDEGQDDVISAFISLNNNIATASEVSGGVALYPGSIKAGKGWKKITEQLEDPEVTKAMVDVLGLEDFQKITSGTASEEELNKSFNLIEKKRDEVEEGGFTESLKEGRRIVSRMLADASDKRPEVVKDIDTLYDYVKSVEAKESSASDRKKELASFSSTKDNLLSMVTNIEKDVTKLQVKTGDVINTGGDGEPTHKRMDSFEGKYNDAYDGAVKSLMHKTYIKLEDEGEGEAAEVVQKYLDKETPVDVLLERSRRLHDIDDDIAEAKAKAKGKTEGKTEAEAEAEAKAEAKAKKALHEKIALDALLSSWPDEQVHWAYNKIKDINEKSGDTPKARATKEAISKGLTRYLSGKAPSIKDGASSFSHEKHLMVGNSPTYAHIQGEVKDAPKKSVKKTIRDLDESLQESFKDTANVMKMRNPKSPYRKAMIGDSEKAKNSLEKLHPHMEKTKAHTLASDVLGSYDAKEGIPLSDKVQKAIEESGENVPAGEKSLTDKQVRHAILDMASAGDKSDYDSVKNLVSDLNWYREKPNTDSIEKAKRLSKDYGNIPEHGSKAHDSFLRTLPKEHDYINTGRTKTESVEDKKLTEIEPGEVDRHLGNGIKQRSRDAQPTSKHVEDTLDEYTSKLKDELSTAIRSKEKAAEEKTGGHKDHYISILSDRIDELTNKLHTYQGLRQAGIPGKYKELAGEAFDHYELSAQSKQDKVNDFKTFTDLRRQRNNTEDKNERASYDENIKLLQEKHNFEVGKNYDEDKRHFNKLLSEATKAYKKAGEVGTLTGRKPTIKGFQAAPSSAVESEGMLPESKHMAISTDLGGGTQKYVHEEAQQLLIRWVNHLRTTGAKDFTDNGKIYEMLDSALESIMKRVGSSYKAEKIKGQTINGVYYPGILANLEKKRDKLRELVKNLAKSDKELSEAYHPIMEELAGLIGENDEDAKEVDDAVGSYFDAYHKESQKQREELVLKEDAETDVPITYSDTKVVSNKGEATKLDISEGVDGVNKLIDSLKGSQELDKLKPEEYSRSLGTIQDKLKKLSEGATDVKFTSVEEAVLGPEALKSIQEDSDSAKKILASGSDRFRDYTKEADELKAKLIFFDGPIAKVRKRLSNKEKIPTFTDRERRLMGHKLSDYVDGIISGEHKGQAGRINSEEAREALGLRKKETYRSFIKDKAKKLKESHKGEVTKTVVGEKALGDVRGLQELMPQITDLTTRYESKVEKIHEDLTDKKIDQDDADELFDKALVNYRNSFRRLTGQKKDFSKGFIKKIEQAFGGSPDLRDLTKTQKILEETIKSANSSMSHKDEKRIASIIDKLEQIKAIEGDPSQYRDPSTMSKALENKEELIRGVHRGYKELKESNHPISRNVVDLAVHHTQTGQSRADGLALLTVRSWLDSTSGEEFQKNGDLKHIIGSEKLRKALNQLHGTNIQETKKINQLVTKAIDGYMDDLNTQIEAITMSGKTDKVVNKDFRQKAFDGFESNFDVAEHIIYRDLGNFFSPASNRVYSKAKDLARTPTIRAGILVGRANNLTGDNSINKPLKNVSGGFFENYEGILKMLGKRDGKSTKGSVRLKNLHTIADDRKAELESSLEKIPKELERRVEDFLSSKPGAKEILSNKDIKEMQHFEAEYPGVIDKKVAEDVDETLESSKTVVVKHRANELLQSGDYETNAGVGVGSLSNRIGPYTKITDNLIKSLKASEASGDQESKDLIAKLQESSDNKHKKALATLQKAVNDFSAEFATYARDVDYSDLNSDTGDAQSVLLGRKLRGEVTRILSDMGELPGTKDITVPRTLAASTKLLSSDKEGPASSTPYDALKNASKELYVSSGAVNVYPAVVAAFNGFQTAKKSLEDDSIGGNWWAVTDAKISSATQNISEAYRALKDYPLDGEKFKGALKIFEKQVGSEGGSVRSLIGKASEFLRKAEQTITPIITLTTEMGKLKAELVDLDNEIALGVEKNVKGAGAGSWRDAKGTISSVRTIIEEVRSQIADSGLGNDILDNAGASLKSLLGSENSGIKSLIKDVLEYLNEVTEKYNDLFADAASGGAPEDAKADTELEGTVKKASYKIGLIKVASGSDDAGGASQSEGQWIEDSVAHGYTGDQEAYQEGDIGGSPKKSHKDLENVRKAFNALKSAYDKKMSKEAKGKKISETKLVKSTRDNLVDSARDVRDSLRHFNADTGLTHNFGNDDMGSLKAQLKAVNTHEREHGSANLSPYHKRVVGEVKTRWAALGEKLERNESVIGAALKQYKAVNSDESQDSYKKLDSLIVEFKAKHEDAKARLLEHAEASEKGADMAVSHTEKMLADLHTLSLKVDNKMSEFVKLVSSGDTIKKVEAIEHLHDAFVKLTRAQAKLRNDRENTMNQIEDLDDSIHKWRKTLSLAEQNNGDGLSPQEKEMWSREFLGQIMHWIMWVWNRNADRFEKMFGATDADFETFSDAAQDKIGLFNNTRVNKLMINITDMLDVLRELGYNNLTPQQRKLWAQLKSERNRLWMYKYSLTNLKGVEDSVRIWANRNNVSLDTSIVKGVQGAMNKAEKESSILAANAEKDREALEAIVDEKTKEELDEKSKAVHKMANMSLGALSTDILTKVINNFSKRK